MWNIIFKEIEKIKCVVGIKAKNDKIILKYGNDDSLFARNINMAVMQVEKIFKKHNIDFSYVYCHSENLVYKINGMQNYPKFDDIFKIWHYINNNIINKYEVELMLSN